MPYYSKPSQLEIAWKNLENGGGTWDKPTYEDLLHNGKYCEYGLAFPISEYTAICTQVDKVIFNESDLESPYQCDPRDNSNWCTFQFNTTAWDGTSQKAESATF